jgi:hypothetical protein
MLRRTCPVHGIGVAHPPKIATKNNSMAAMPERFFFIGLKTPLHLPVCLHARPACFASYHLLVTSYELKNA